MRELTVTELDEVSGGLSLSVNAGHASSLSFSDRSFDWSLSYKGASSGAYTGSGNVFLFDARNISLESAHKGQGASIQFTA